MQHVQHEVPAVEDVVALPGRPEGVCGQGAVAIVDELMPDAAAAVQGGERRIGGCGVIRLAAVLQQVDGGGNQLDMSEFLGGDAGDQVIEWEDLVTPTHVERLVHVVVQCGHFAEAAAHQLLHGGGGGGIGVDILGQINLQFVNSLEHREGSSLDCWTRTENCCARQDYQHGLDSPQSIFTITGQPIKMYLGDWTQKSRVGRWSPRAAFGSISVGLRP